MKHLKTYKIFEGVYDIPAEEFVKNNTYLRDSILDIVEDLKDNNLNIRISILNERNGGNIINRSFGGVHKVEISIDKLSSPQTYYPDIDLDDADEYDELIEPHEFRERVPIRYEDIKHPINHLTSFLSENGFIVDNLGVGFDRHHALQFDWSNDVSNLEKVCKPGDVKSVLICYIKKK